MTYDSQAVALIAYLQRLGTDISAAPEPTEEELAAAEENAVADADANTQAPDEQARSVPSNDVPQDDAPTRPVHAVPAQGTDPSSTIAQVNTPTPGAE